MRTMKYIAGITAPVLAGVCAVCLMAGGAYAYFSGQAETVNNQFHIVKGSLDEKGAISIEEPLWNTADADSDGIPDAAENLEPGSIVKKNPSVKSNAEYDGWVVMKITMPKTLAAMKKGDALSKLEVFDLRGLNETDFKLLDSKTDGDASAQYFYGYKRILKAHSSTEELFREIAVKNFAVVNSSVTASVDLDAKITQSVDPSTGTVYRSVEEAYQAMGGRF